MKNPNLKMEEIDSFPPNADILQEDRFRLARDFGNDWFLMYFQHNDEEFAEVIFVHVPTGKRWKVEVIDG